MSTFISILKEKTEAPKIDRIGLQIRKDSTTFSDNATGSIPQIDAIIKTTDGKIYKATQNLNSTYTDYDGNKTTTTNAAEPVGASMCEKFVKEYEWRNQENTNNAQAKVIYGNGIYLSSTIGDLTLLDDEVPQWSDYRNLYYSKNGKKWNQILLDNAIKTKNSNINEYMISDICYGNGKFVVAIIADDMHLLFGYSTNAIDWEITQFTGLSNDYSIAVIKICYGNNKYSGLATIATNNNEQSCYSIYSTDGINWNSNIVKTNFGNIYYPDLVRDICYGNNKFISIVSIFEDKKSSDNPVYKYSLNDNLYYSTDGINWTSTIALSTFEHLQRIFYINNKFYLCSNMNYAYSTDGINWTKYTPKWSDGTVMDDNSFLSTQIMCKYDNNSLLGLFIDNSKNYNSSNAQCDFLTGYVVCKSSDGITWHKLYNIDIHVDENNTESFKGLHPSNMIYVNDNICIVSNSAFIPYTYTRWIHYYWTVNKKDNNELSYSITDQPSFMIYDPIPHTALNQVEEIFGTIDTTQFENFTEGDLDEHPTGAYRFSGWSQSNITFTKDTPRVTEITGTWNWVDMVKYSYSWNAPSYSDLTGLVTLPTGGSTYAGETVSVDTKYNSDSKVEVLNWTQGTLPISQQWYSVCYGNGKFVAIGNNSNIFIYSTDAITWTQGTMPSSQRWYSVCYGNGKFVAISSGSNKFAYSTDAITWTEGTMPSSGWNSVCYGNGKYIAYSSNKYAYSTDGINWTQGTLPFNITNGKNNICYGAGKFVAISYNSNEYAYSTDGITWTKGTLASNNTDWYSICYGNGKFVAANNDKDIIYSSDGINWVEISNIVNFQINYIYYGSGLFIIIPRTANGRISYSIDGINWIKGKLPSYNTSYCYGCYGNGKFVILNAVTYTDTFYYLTLPTSYYQFSGWNPSTDFIINENKTISGTWSKKNKLRVSYSWSNQPSGMKSKVPSDEYYHSGDNVTIDTTYNNKSGYKEEKINANEGTMPIAQPWQSVCYGNGKFIAVPGDTTIDSIYPDAFVYSTDGITWTQGTISGKRDWISVCYGNGKYVAVSWNSNIFAYSTDGITWTEGTMPSSQEWDSVCYGNGRFVAVSGYSKNTSNIFAYSTNGIKWTQGTMPSSQFWISVCYGNGKYVAVSWNSNIFAYSTDGITWTKGTMPSSQYWGSVCYGNGKFVAVTWSTSSSNAFAYSTDGINWTQGTMPSNQTWGSVCYGNGKFVAVCDQSIVFAYSTDGINWTQGTMPNSNGWSSVCYGNGMFVAISHGSIYFAYFTISTSYYQFSGWNKSDFNITADTSITGSWSTVSSGDGLNFID